MMMLSFDDFPGGSDGKESACNVGAAAAKSLQSCLTLCNPIDGSPPGSLFPGVLQPRTLEWVAVSFSNSWKWKVNVKLLSCVRLFAIPWTAAHQAPPSMGSSRQEYWNGVPLPSPNNTLSKYKNKISIFDVYKLDINIYMHVYACVYICIYHW